MISRKDMLVQLNVTISVYKTLVPPQFDANAQLSRCSANKTAVFEFDHYFTSESELMRHVPGKPSLFHMPASVNDDVERPRSRVQHPLPFWERRFSILMMFNTKSQHPLCQPPWFAGLSCRAVL